MRTFLFALVFVTAGCGQGVHVWVTTADRRMLLQPQADAGWNAGGASAPVIRIDESLRYQQIEGFGASFTDSAAYLMNQKIPKAALPGVMKSLFDPEDGIGVSFVRNPMGASDLARYVYSYDDTLGGLRDPDLAGFSIDHDRADILPLLLQAKAIDPRLRVMASPWSPPGWMKTSGAMIGGALAPAASDALALYFVKYLQAYQAAGVPVDYLSLQNEPLYSPNDYPGMLMTAAEQLALLRDHVLPALQESKIATRVLVYDHNWDRPDYPQTVLADPAIRGNPLVAGIAWHWYGGTPGVMNTLHRQYPNMMQHVTEASGGTWMQEPVRQDFEMILESLRNWSAGFVKWSLALDEKRGPHSGGCGSCRGLITVDESSGAVTNTIDYYTLGHFSKFIRPGARRVDSNNIAGVIGAAFVNPDGTRVLVAFNDSQAARTFQVNWNGRMFAYSLPSYAGATFVWDAGMLAAPRHSATVLLPAPRPVSRPEAALSACAQPVMASSFTAADGLQTGTASDSDGGFDLGFASDASWAAYQPIDFTCAPGSLEARVASAGSGGLLEFRIDGVAGPLIASAALPVTGGWQTWKTVAAPVRSPGGTHPLYVTFHGAGAGGIGNLNWFRFR